MIPKPSNIPIAFHSLLASTFPAGSLPCSPQFYRTFRKCYPMALWSRQGGASFCPSCSPCQRNSGEDEAATRPERSEQILEVPTLQDCDDRSGQICAPKGRQAGVSGPPGRQLARAHSHQIEELPRVPSGNGHATVHQAPLWPLVSTRVLHQVHSGSSGTLAQRGVATLMYNRVRWRHL